MDPSQSGFGVLKSHFSVFKHLQCWLCCFWRQTGKSIHHVTTKDLDPAPLVLEVWDVFEVLTETFTHLPPGLVLVRWLRWTYTHECCLSLKCLMHLLQRVSKTEPKQSFKSLSLDLFHCLKFLFYLRFLSAVRRSWSAQSLF